MSGQVLERFHRALIEEIQTQHPQYLTTSFTVAEIYQNLVPYSSHRDRIGVEMNGDYEDALVRLLAGEGGYLILDSEPALRDLRAELDSSHPNTGIYREFAAVDVRLNQAYLDLSGGATDRLPDLVRQLEAPVMMGDLAPSEETAGLGIVPPGVDIFGSAPLAERGSRRPDGTAGAGRRAGASFELAESDPVASAEAFADEGSDAPELPVPSSTRPPLAPEFVDDRPAARSPAPAPAETSRCRSCGSGLPTLAGDGVNFCPFCGADLRDPSCRSCGTALDVSWQFCPHCGTEATA